MIAFILDQIISPFWPYILAALGVVGAFLTGRMGGAAKAKAKQAEANAKAHQRTIEEVLRETPSDDPADDIRRRLSERARKP